MNDRPTFEARLEGAFAAYADRAPVEVDPISMTASVAHGRPGRARLVINLRGSRLAIATVLALLAIGAALVAGAYLLRSHDAIGGGGFLLIVQADLPTQNASPETLGEHVYTFDVVTGERRPIVDWDTRHPYFTTSPAWSPDRTHAVLRVSGAPDGIVDVASHQLSPIQLGQRDTSIRAIAWARSSDRVASIVGNDTTNTQGILISDLAGREIGRLPVPSGWLAQSLTWSPDGRSLILAGCLLPCADGVYKGNLLEVPIDGSRMRVLLEPADPPWLGPAIWSPDGSTIAFETSSGIQTLDIATGRRTSVTQGKDGQPTWSGNDTQPAWSPDGRHLAFARMDDQSANGAIYVVDVDGANLRRLTNDTSKGSVSDPRWSPDGSMLTFIRQDGEMYYQADLWIVGADGGAPRLLVPNAKSDW